MSSRRPRFRLRVLYRYVIHKSKSDNLTQLVPHSSCIEP